VGSAKDNLVHLFGPRAAGGVSAEPPAVDAGAVGLSRTVRRGERIFTEGETADFFYKVVSGVVRTYTILDDGRRQIAGFHLPGDVFGLEAGTHHRFSANGLSAATIVAYSRPDLDTLLEANNALRKQVLTSLVLELDRVQDHVLLLGHKTAREKIEVFLLCIAERASRSQTSNLPLQRSDIADFLGLSRETVSRTLTQLACNGIIEVKGRPNER
jgi:CRP/FNR family transcriptional regulator, nitrogen fixation regulation protein